MYYFKIRIINFRRSTTDSPSDFTIEFDDFEFWDGIDELNGEIGTIENDWGSNGAGGAIIVDNTGNTVKTRTAKFWNPPVEPLENFM